MSQSRIFIFSLLGLAIVVAAGSWWANHWVQPGIISPSGGLWWPMRQEMDVPHFSQSDPRWGDHLLGSTDGTLAKEGCAVAAAAMVLSSYGIDTDPGRLNKFLTDLRGGFTPEGWIYWEAAALFEPKIATQLLPHYENEASHALIDHNLRRGNPVIVRLRYPSGVTHFVVIAGKSGFDYLILDPAKPPGSEMTALREFGSPIEALRFYSQPQTELR